jgi:hypothetical protein
MFLVCTQKASDLPFSMEVLRLHCRIDPDDDRDDAILRNYAWSVIRQGEFATNRIWLDSVWRAELPCFPDSANAGCFAGYAENWPVFNLAKRSIIIKLTPCTKINSITYKNASDAEVSFAGFAFKSSSLTWDGGRTYAEIELPAGTDAWPVGTDVIIDFRAGWPAAFFPEEFVTWILTKASGHFEQREDLASATRKMAIPMQRSFTDGFLDAYYLPK